MLMSVTRELQQLIQNKSPADELLAHSLAVGARALRQDGIEKVLAAVTSIEEVLANS
jgi:type II secretory ATPase GspE/PulE/Tfp pilus assembly ATPase PilB-like protein